MTTRFLAAALLAGLASACTSSASTAKTEVLPANGGDVAKDYAELAAAFKAGDKARATPLIDPNQWNLANKEASWFQQFAEQMSDVRPTGGRRQGDRATMFVESGDKASPYYAMVNATL